MRNKNEDPTNPPTEDTESSIQLTLDRLEALTDLIGHYFDDDDIEILAIDDLDALGTAAPINDGTESDETNNNIIPFPRQK